MVPRLLRPGISARPRFRPRRSAQGLHGAGDQHRSDRDAGSRQSVAVRQPLSVAVNTRPESRARRHEAVRISPDRRSLHHAGPIIVFEYNRAFMAASVARMACLATIFHSRCRGNA